MYKFTNGIVVFDEKTRDRYIEAGYKLIKNINCNKETTNVAIDENNEVIDENTSNNGIIEEKPRRSKKISK